MQRTAVLIRPSTRQPAAAAWLARMKQAWAGRAITDEERYLREARDPVEVEWRLKRLERGRTERFGRLDPHA